MALTRAMASLLLAGTMAQKPGRQSEGGPTMPLRECTLSGGCASTTHKVTLDANWRWTHESNTNCFTDGDWNKRICSDGETCASKCVVEGITSEQYKSSYGITAIDNGIQLEFVKKHSYGTNFGSRVYLMDDADSYKMFKLKNREFTMDFDVSEAPCGLNGAMYFVEMDQSGDYGGGNKAGAKYGTGYCDAQCPHDVKWIHGEGNVKNWTVGNPSRGPSEGHYGACCQELDIWEANSMANAYTPHPCQKSGETLVGNYKCEGVECGDNGSGERYKGVCDKDGCDFNPYRMGNKSFYGKGKIIDTSKPITVVTQFITTDGTDDGDLSEMRRLYVQDGEIIANSVATNVPGSHDSITDEFCDAQKETYGNRNEHAAKGGLAEMGRSLDRGHVMVMSVWDDPAVNMNWLDSAYPLDVPASDAGVERGPCPGGVSSTPAYLRSHHPNARVRFSNAAVGEIGSTFAVNGPQPTPRPTPSPTPHPSPSPTPVGDTCSEAWQQCGGRTWTGATCCQEGLKCNAQGEWYSQCVPQSSLAEVRRLRGPVESCC